MGPENKLIKVVERNFILAKLEIRIDYNSIMLWQYYAMSIWAICSKKGEIQF